MQVNWRSLLLLGVVGLLLACGPAGESVQPGIEIGLAVPVRDAVAPMGDNLDFIFYFKEYSFYDGTEGSTLTHLVWGETYHFRVRHLRR